MDETMVSSRNPERITDGSRSALRIDCNAEHKTSRVTLTSNLVLSSDFSSRQPFLGIFSLHRMDQFHVRQLMNLRGLCPVCDVIFCYWGGGEAFENPHVRRRHHRPLCLLCASDSAGPSTTTVESVVRRRSDRWWASCAAFFLLNTFSFHATQFLSCHYCVSVVEDGRPTTFRLQHESNNNAFIWRQLLTYLPGPRVFISFRKKFCPHRAALIWTDIEF